MDLWGSFVGRADMYMWDGLYPTGKGAAVFVEGHSAAWVAYHIFLVVNTI